MLFIDLAVFCYYHMECFNNLIRQVNPENLLINAFLQNISNLEEE